MNVELIFATAFGTVLGFCLRVAHEWWITRRREEEKRKRTFRTLLDELRDIAKRCDVSVTTIRDEMLKMHPTAPIFFSTLVPLSNLGWESLRSTGISATLDAGTLDRLYAIYNQVDTHNKLITLREGYITSDVPTSILPIYIKDYDEKLLKTLASIEKELRLVEPEIERRASFGSWKVTSQPQPLPAASCTSDRRISA